MPEYNSDGASFALAADMTNLQKGDFKTNLFILLSSLL